MDIPRLLRDAEARQKEFPVTAHKVFMAHAAASPLPRRVAEAVQSYVGCAADSGQWEYLYDKTEKETRRYAAHLLGVSEDEIAFTTSTSMGLSMVACGLNMGAGDSMVIADGDFPSNIYPWLNLQYRGVEVRFIPRNLDGSITLDNLARVIDGTTRLVSLSSVNFVTGCRLDISAFGKYLRERDILFCVDAVQSLGVLPIDTTWVDFVASSAHKWLLGPLGIGILMVKKQRLEKLRPMLTGWKSVADCHDYLRYNLCFVDSAGRYEPGGQNILGIFGLHAALELLLEVGVENIQARLRTLRAAIVPALLEKGYHILGPVDCEQPSGIISFSSPAGDTAQLRSDLESRGFVVSLREDLEGHKCIRLSPHFYNTEDEVERLLAQLPDRR